MNHLRRNLSPITDPAWTQVDEEATRSLKLYLAGRRLVDVHDPLGWDVDSVPTGVVRMLDSGYAVRQPAPMIELRTPFTMSLANLDLADRGNSAIDTDPVISAARLAARAEDVAIFSGVEGAAQGILPASPHDAIPLPTSISSYPTAVARAVEVLRAAGIGGPYALALGDAEYTGVAETTEHGGYPVLAHLRSVLGGDVVWAPALTGGVVVSTRGGDFDLSLGQEFSIGYAGTDGDEVHLYLEESIAFRVFTPEASVQLPA
jgi:uncharacterized linocin/CFP29 family protein